MSVSPERWKQIETIFQEAMDLPPEMSEGERKAWLQLSCCWDVELQKEVESLLGALPAASDGLQKAVAEAASEASDNTVTLGGFGAAVGATETGMRVGAFELTREIGRGGMGTVYLARRTGGEFEQTAAVKLVSLGLSTDPDGMAERFRAERRILATLDHPNIAKLLDGGSIPDGRPYFVMEYVPGETVTDFCSHHKLDLNARLRLFLDICSAVEHAHQRMIIHRDIKPANILVLPGAIPKLLDFGIAKLIDPGTGAATDLTSAGMRLLTPDYASPEQIRAEPVSAATDVYALGAVLFEMLTGQKAHKISSQSALEMERAICFDEIRKPSGVGGPFKIDEDLDNIVLMAMRKEQNRRYQSVTLLAEDIRRFLDGRPVSARRDTFSYRAFKFLGRNKLAAAAAGLLAAAITVGVVSTLHEARKAERRFGQVRTLARKFLFDFDEKISQVPGNTAAREMLVKTALEYLDSLAAEASGDQTLQGELAAAYQKVGEIQGLPGVPNLGHPEQTVISHGKAIAIYRSLAAAAPSDAIAQRNASRALVQLARVHSSLGNFKEAEKALRSAMPYAQKLQALPATDPKEAARNLQPVIGITDGLARMMERNGDRAAAIRLGEANLENTRKAERMLPTRKTSSDVGLVLTSLAQDSAANGGITAAHKYLQEAEMRFIDLLKKYPGNVELAKDLCNVYFYRAGIYTKWGVSTEDKAAALRDWRKCLEFAQQRLDADPKNADALYDVVNNSLQLASALAAQQEPGGRELYQRAKALTGNMKLTGQHWKTVPATLYLTLAEVGDKAGARANLEQGISELEKVLQSEPGLGSAELVAAKIRFGEMIGKQDRAKSEAILLAAAKQCEENPKSFSAAVLGAKVYRELFVVTGRAEWKIKETAVWSDLLKSHPGEPFIETKSKEAAAL